MDRNKPEADTLVRLLKDLSDKETAAHSQRFFKTGKGEYGEGDVFLGIRVPVIRKQISTFRDMPLTEVQLLLASPYHEVRLSGLLLLVDKFKKGSPGEQEEVYTLYLNNTHAVNNWDLVDSSAPHIVGAYLTDRDRTVLSTLVRSPSLWERRIAIMATFSFIRRGEYAQTLELAAHLLHDPEDLIHKAVGWMLREVGKRDAAVERAFLRRYYRKMPRTMLRYAIEKFPEAERKRYLGGDI